MAAMLETERDGRVLVVRIYNPPRNFMNRVMVGELDELTRSLRGDGLVGAVVLTGRPSELFVTHYDVGEILAGVEDVGIAPPPALSGAMLRLAGGLRRVPGLGALAERTPLRGLFELHRIHDVFMRMSRTDKVFVAAINGPATGGGCELALACDLRYMAEGEYRIGLPEMTLGFNPGAGGTQRLARTLGHGRALEMMLEGRTLSPHEAAELGLVHRVVPRDRLLPEAVETAHRLARRSPGSIEALKRAVYDGGSRRLKRGLAVERKWFMVEGASDASKRAMAAFGKQMPDHDPSPWVDPSSMRDWQQGTAADLVGDEPDED
jgi:enoyl-CoA hydratase/carnithine racemase